MLKVCHYYNITDDVKILIFFFFIDSRITNIRTSGAGSYHIETLNRSLELSISAGSCLDKELMRVLAVEDQSEKKEVFGFLK